MPGVGDLIPPTFEILDITWDENATSVIYSPSVVASDTYNNGGSSPIKQDFTLSWEESNTQTMTWKHAWGIGFSYSYKAGLIPSVAAKHEFSVEISYNREYGKSSVVQTTTKFERKVSLQAAAKKKTVQTVAKKAPSVTIPFTAKIKRTKADGSVSIIEEQGEWQGVAYHSAHLDIQE